MTLYCQTLDQLPEKYMKSLGKGSRATHFWEEDPETGADVERYTYAWRDFQIDLYINRRPEICAHLESFLTYASNLARARRQTLDPDFMQRVRSTQLVIGYVAQPDIEKQDRFDRLESMILTLSADTQSLFFWEGDIYNEDGHILLT